MTYANKKAKIIEKRARACTYQKNVVSLQPNLFCVIARVNIGELEILFGQHPELAAVRKELAHADAHVLLSGLHASARALALAQVGHPQFVIFDNAESAQYLYADLKTVGADAGFFPSSKRRRTVDDAAVIQRTETLSTLPRIIVTYPEAIAEPVPAKEELAKMSMTLKVGQEIQQSALSSQLSDLGFERVDFVFQPGQYAVRGSIVDIYSYGHDIPYRFDFFGDEIDSIREFDIEDQLSKNKVESAEIVGAQHSDVSIQYSIVDYLSEDYVWVSNDFGMVKFKLDSLNSGEAALNSSEGAFNSAGGTFNGAQRLWCQDSQLETDLPVCFPTDYIENISERITLYRELDSLRSEEQLLDFRKRLIDRFGALPEAAEELLDVVRLRWICCRLGIEKILLKGERMTMYLVQHKDAYWQSEVFGNMIQYAATRPERCMLNEERDKKGVPTGRRYITIMHVKTINGAMNLLSKIEKGEL